MIFGKLMKNSIRLCVKVKKINDPILKLLPTYSHAFSQGNINWCQKNHLCEHIVLKAYQRAIERTNNFLNRPFLTQVIGYRIY